MSKWGGGEQYKIQKKFDINLYSTAESNRRYEGLNILLQVLQNV